MMYENLKNAKIKNFTMLTLNIFERYFGICIKRNKKVENRTY